MIIRGLLVLLFLLGFTIGCSGGLCDGTQGLAVYKIHQANEIVADAKVAAVLKEARDAAEGSWLLMRISMYSGIAVALTAGVVLNLLGKRPSTE